MLSKMYLTNFLSFKRRTEFDFTASKYCILKQTNVNAKETFLDCTISKRRSRYSSF